MSVIGRRRERCGRGGGRGAKARSSASGYVFEREALASPVVETGSHDRAGVDELTQIVKEVLEEVKGISEALRVECVDCKNERDCGFFGSQSRSVKRVKARPNVSDCDYYRRHHPRECWRRSGACLRCGSKEHKARDCFITIKSGMFWSDMMIECRKF